ncbi:uncharacterized protein BJ212DRAFT_9901 [Suillus subaureus]|uniref:C2H2-type domain-containing protein n=1 Tax=Suillus subaureus TaxID=48587 RepID=A0A9P7EPC0_9AGAM|nr:uncharacterized protein BJ212DRAFT_9901 [Suillus subaureus]KAG1826840.1 hypothetical protein BJ212DRAFT_9901 [Suillus subaureus]
MNMNNNGAHRGLPTPSSSSTYNTPFISNGTFVASAEGAQPQLQGQPPLPLQQVSQTVFNRPAQPQPQPPHYPKAYHLPAQTTTGPSLNALNAIANENAGLGIRPPGMPAQTWNTAPPPIPKVPQGAYQWPAYGHHLPVQNYYGGYSGPRAQGAAPYAAPHQGPQMHAPPAPAVQATHLQQQQVLPNAAPPPHAQNVAPFAAPYQGHRMHAPPAGAVQVPHLQQQQVLQNVAPPPPATQEHVFRTPGDVNLRVPSLNQEVQQAPPAHWLPPAPFAGPPYQQQQPQQAMPQVPSVGPAEGSSTRPSKRKAVDNDTTTQSRQKRHRPQGDPDFEPAPPGEDGKPRWKCLKQACAHVKPMLENSVHKHITATVSHQKDSEGSLTANVCPGCGFSFKRPDALKRHGPTDQCTRNKAKALQSAQESFQTLWNNTFAAGPSSSGSASNYVTNQSLPLPMAAPGIVQAAWNNTFGAAAPFAMPQQQFTFRASEPSSMTQPSGAQAARTEPMIQHVPSLPVLPQTVPSLPELQAPVEQISVQQQPAVTHSLHAIQGHSSTSEQTSTPLPFASVRPSSGDALPIIAGDFSFSMFGQTAASSSPSPSEDEDDSFDGLFSSRSSPSPPEDVNDSSEGPFSS